MQPTDRAQPDGGARGPLRLLAFLLTAWEPLNGAVAAAMAFNAVRVRGTPVAIVLVLRLVATAVCLGAGRALRDARAGGVPLARLGLLLSGAVQVFAMMTPYFPSNRVPGDTPIYVAAIVAYYGGWLAYLAMSGRARAAS